MSGKRKDKLNEFTNPNIGKNALEIVTALALPEEMQRVIRFADQYSCDKTSVCIPWQERKVNWDGTTAANSALPAGTMMFFIFRDPLRRLVVYFPNPTNLGYKYNLYFPGGGGITSNSPVTTLFLVPGVTVFANPIYALPDASSQNNAHGNILYPLYDSNGDCGNYSWIWLDCVASTSGQINFTFNIDQGTGTKINVWKRVNGQRVFCNTVTTVATVLSVSISITASSGYYAFDITGTNAGSTVTVQFQCTNGSIWCQLCDTDMQTNMLHVNAIRTLGCAFRFTNEASPLNQQGNIIEAQIPAADSWENYTVVGAYNVLSSYPTTKSRVAAKGTDGFLKPMQADDFKFLSPFTLNSTGNLLEAYNDVNDHDFGFIAVACSTTNTLGGDFILRVTPLVEYKTKNSWIPQSVPEHTTADWIEALEIFKSLEQFYDNPVHVRDILRTIGYYAAIGARWGTKIAKVAAYLAQ